MDYRANGVGEVLNENAINHPDMYEKLFAPDTAAGYLLNLLDNPDKVELSAGEPGENGSVPVTICFALDGSMVKLNMIQPYGEDGIWIPQTYGVTTKVGKAVDGSGNSETWFVGW